MADNLHILRAPAPQTPSHSEPDFATALAAYDAVTAAMGADDGTDATAFDNLADAQHKAMAELARAAAPDLASFKSKYQRVMAHYGQRDICMIENGTAAALLLDLDRLTDPLEDGKIKAGLHRWCLLMQCESIEPGEATEVDEAIWLAQAKLVAEISRIPARGVEGLAIKTWLGLRQRFGPNGLDNFSIDLPKPEHDDDFTAAAMIGAMAADCLALSPYLATTVSQCAAALALALAELA
jgi:hypothetical protein